MHLLSAQSKMHNSLDITPAGYSLYYSKTLTCKKKRMLFLKLVEFSLINEKPH
jgi:hypothetical protein